MYVALLILHLFICLALVGVVLIQSGKGGGLAGGAFGGSAQTVFGGRGATDFITRATMVLGAAFFITSLSLALMSTRSGRASRSLIQSESRRQSAGAPPAPRSGSQAGQPAGGSAVPGATPSGGAAPGGAAPSGGGAPSGGSAPPGGSAPAPTPTPPGGTTPPGGGTP